MNTDSPRRGGQVPIRPLRKAPASKTCPACGKEKPARAFGSCAWTPDLLGHKCRDCTNQRNRQLALARKAKHQQPGA